VVVAVWVLDAALLVVSQVIATVVATVVGSERLRTRKDGLETLLWCYRLVWECRHSRGAGGCPEAGGGVVVVTVSDVDSTDGGCAGVVSDDVGDSGDSEGVVVDSSRGAVCMKASAVEADVV
jgi:hypothetical protein